MASGGRRKGMQGKAYPNRTDLMAQPVRTATNQPYGQAGAQQQAQQAIPLPQAAPPPLPQVVGPNEPTQRPGEHVMTGVNRGPGLGPEAIVPPPVNMSSASSNADVYANLLALAQAHPNPGMLELIRSIKLGDYSRGGLYGKSIGGL